MPVQRNDEGYSALAQLLTASDIQSPLNSKYIDYYLRTGGDINYQISDNTASGFTKPELLGCTLLHLAYKQHKLELFNLLLINGADYTIRNSSGNTVLHQIIEDTYAKEAECSEPESISDNPYVDSVLDALAQSGNSYNDSNKKGLTYFHIACMANHKPAVILFLMRGRLYNQSVFKDSPIFPGYTPLHCATRFSNLEIVKILLEFGAVHNIMDAKGMTPLHLLIEQNIAIADLLNKSEVVNAGSLTIMRKTNEDIIHLLLSKCTSVCQEQMDVIDDINLIPLHIACIVESLPITDDLLGNATNINYTVNCRSSLFSGNTALHFAALCNVEKVKLLLQKGANINLQNAKGQTAFDLCLERYELKDICDIIKSQPNWTKVQLVSRGKTLLHLVSHLQNYHISPFEVIRKLGNPQINKKSPLWPSYTLLHVAVALSERGCKNDRMIVEGFTSIELGRIAKRAVSPLHLAFRQKKRKVVNFLLTCNSRVPNLIDCDKLSHLHIACAAGVTSAVEKLLLLSNANVNLALQTSFEWFRYDRPDCNAPGEVYLPKGSTPLHVAVIVGHCETMKLLLARGADVYARDEHGMTPIHWLIASDNPISPAADILLSTSRPVSTTSRNNGNKRFATSSTIKDCTTDTGLSHLHVACLANNVSVVEQLLRRGSMINAISYRAADDDTRRFPGRVRYAGYSPLHFALEGNCEETVSLLLRRGAHVMTKNVVKNSIPLYQALTDEQSSCAGVLREFFKNNKTLQERLAKDLNLDMLHFYCCVMDVDAAENLLNGGAANANISLFWNSPVWPGFTPLHVLIEYYQTCSHVADVLLMFLLDYGANVTLKNAEKNSPIHMVFDLDIAPSLKTSLLQSLLRSQKNFNINPQNSRGLSHFHIACAIVDIATIENFLKSNVDVNQSIDYFFENRENSELNGRTPLHLVLSHPLNEDVEVAITLEAVASLVQCGADVKAEDVFKNSPLHLAAHHHPQCIDLLKTIIDGGGNMYAENILAQTPLEIMLNSKDATVDGVKFFLDRGCRANAFNPITQKGFVAITFSTHPYCIFQQQKLIFDLMTEACCNTLDEMGRTVIHNIVSTSMPVISDKFYGKIIESLGKIVNIDHQDNLGRTALHVATQFKNHHAIFALLQAGADINIIDANGKTAFVYAFETSPFFEGSLENSETIVRIFSSYVQKLNVCLLDVHEMNHSALIDAFKNYNVDGIVNHRFYRELKKMKNVQVGSSSLTLQDLISGTSTEAVSLCMPDLQFNVITDLCVTIDKERFCESLGIIRFQCRKISKKIVVSEEKFDK